MEHVEQLQAQVAPLTTAIVDDSGCLQTMWVWGQLVLSTYNMNLQGDQYISTNE